MANLRVNKITGTEVFETTGSVQFDGSGDVLTVPNTADFRLGSSDFTLECFMCYVGPLSSNRTLFGLFENSSARRSYQLEVRSTGVLRFEWWADGSTTNAIDSPTSSISSSQWTHIAVVRNGSVITIYINGNSVATSNVGTSSFFDNTVDSFRIGALNAAVDQSFSGHISNVRILKGTALYTKNFTPPTRELTVIPNTVLLACTSTTNTAQEATGKTITVYGNAVANELTPGLLTDRVKSGGTSAITGSVEFNDSYLTFDKNVLLDLNNYSDWTIECWIYRTANASNTRGLIIGFDVSGNINSNILAVDNNGSLYMGSDNGSNATPRIQTPNNTISFNSWYHISAAKKSSSIKLFVNGIESASGTRATWTFVDLSIPGLIGNREFSDTEFFGFISNLRVLKGTALYTSNFIPPTRELKKLPGTVLLCCKNSNDPTAEETGKTITANGDPAASNFTPQIGSDGSVTFDGVTKINTQNYFYIPTGNTENRFPNFRGADASSARGLFAGGYITPAFSNIIDYVTISTLGNAADFGDLFAARRASSSAASPVRGVFSGGYSPTILNTIDFVTISSTGNASDFGDLTNAERSAGSCSNSTRALFAGGVLTPGGLTNTIDYVTIFSSGIAIDFGDVISVAEGMSGCASPTRGLFGGGSTPTGSNVIQYVTISTTANAVDFGDLTVARWVAASFSNSTRGLWVGGRTPTAQNVIDYVTIATTGNALDFGDLTVAKLEVSGCASSTRGLVAGGFASPANTNVIEYVTIDTTGNAQDFGDLTAARVVSSCSNGHGGLG